MCVAIPSRVVELDETTATVERFGDRLVVSLILLPEPVELGDYVIVQARAYAVEKIGEEEAEQSLALFREWLAAEHEEGGEAAPLAEAPSRTGASRGR
jgi:hydrogenase expression/formation protein HypC